MADFHLLEWTVLIQKKKILTLTVNKVLCKSYLLMFYVLCKQTRAFHVSDRQGIF
jgi:hypothetical protein